MNSSKQTGVALVGLGMVSSAYVQAFRDLSAKVSVRGVYARNGKSRAAFLERNAKTLPGPCRSYGDVDEIAADESVDAVIIATPPNARHELVGKFSAAGKHILMEKPVERTTAAAAELCEICEANHVLFGIMLQQRTRPAALRLREWVSSGEFGALCMAEIRVPWWRDQAYYDEAGRGTYDRDGGGVLISQAIHTLDLALSLMGPVKRVQAMAATTRAHRMESEDFVSVGMELVNGGWATLFATTSGFPGGPESITLHYEKASLEMKSNQLKLTRRAAEGGEKFSDSPKETVETEGTGGGADPMAFPSVWHEAIIDDFCTAIQESREPLVSGRTALAVHQLIDSILLSARSGRSVDIVDI